MWVAAVLRQFSDGNKPEPTRVLTIVATSLLDRFEQRVIPLMDDAYTLARHLVRDEHEAQDIVQESFLRAWRYFAGFRGGDERAWLLTIVRNCCYSWRRGKRGTEDISYDDEAHSTDATSRLPADARAIGESERGNLASALETLPAEFREVLVLRDIEDFSYREIARITGVPIGTVMSRLARARERLRRVLKRTA
jgi:RNA polymerase sigma-70 factor (ECF subfamily)